MGAMVKYFSSCRKQLMNIKVVFMSKSKKVLCHDPAFETNVKVFHKYDLIDFLRAWEKSYHLAYVVEKRHED